MEKERFNFLDEPGLRLYDELIKAYINEKNNAGGEALVAESERAKAAEADILAQLASLGTETSASFESVNEKLDILNGDGEGSVKKAVADAVDSVVAGAPEALDTLKELADWIKADETASAALVKEVSLKANKDYVDAEVERIYDSINSIEEDSIKFLFKDMVVFEGENLANAIEALGENEVLVLSGDEVITENLNITKNAFIDANGAEFKGTITVAPEAKVIIKNAVFSNPVNLKEAA